MAKKKKKAAPRTTTKKVRRRAPTNNEGSQTVLPGMVQDKNAELEDAAKDLLRTRSKLKGAKLAFAESYVASKNAMTKAKLKVYECKDVSFDLILSCRDDEVKIKERRADS